MTSEPTYIDKIIQIAKTQEAGTITIHGLSKDGRLYVLKAQPTGYYWSHMCGSPKSAGEEDHGK